jgi:hypothetical protein
LSESIQYHSSVSQGSHLVPIFLILDINGALDIFENVSVLGYADDLKLFMTIKCIGDCQLFQRDLDRLGECCHSNKFKLISFRRNMQPIEFVYLINGTAFKKADEIKDLGVIMDGKMSFLPHIEAIISESLRMLGFIKCISRDFCDPNLEQPTCVWSLYHSLSSERLERVQHNFIRYAMRRLPWRVYPLPAYDARCLLIGFEVLSDKRIVASALFARDILVGGPCSHELNISIEWLWKEIIRYFTKTKVYVVCLVSNLVRLKPIKLEISGNFQVNSQ